MAYSVVSFIGNGSNTMYPVNFTLGFISRDDVAVYVDGAPVSFTWINNGVIELTTAPAAGSLVVISRAASKTSLTHNYSDGAVVVESNLDDSNLQHMMNSHELLDRAILLGYGDVLNTTLPTPVADQGLKYNADATGIDTFPLPSVNTVAEAIDSVSAVADQILHVDTVATHIANVDTVAGDISNIDTVSLNISPVINTGANITNVNTVSGSIDSVNTVSAAISDVNTVSGSIANVNAAGTNIAAINTVASDLNEAVSEIDLVAGSIANVDSVGSHITGVATVAGNILDVNTVATNLADVTNFADVYLGPSATEPSTRNDGTALQVGDLFFHTGTDEIGTFNGSVWIYTVPFKAYREVDIEVTVGTGGNYATINAALEGLTTKFPMYKSGGVKATIRLLDGFIMQEQVLVEGINLGWITIVMNATSVSTNSAALTTPFHGYTPLFGVAQGGYLPIINALFVFNAANSGSSKHGIMATGGGSGVTVLPGSGVIFAGGQGLYVSVGAHAQVSGGQFKNSASSGINANHGAVVLADNVDVSSSGVGIYASGGSKVTAIGSIANYPIVSGYSADKGSTIIARGGSAIDAPICVDVKDGSTVDVSNGTLTGASNIAIQAFDGSTIIADGADGTGCRGPINILLRDSVGYFSGYTGSLTSGAVGVYLTSGSRASATDISLSGNSNADVSVANGSIASLKSFTGTTNIAKNTPTANGIIFG